MLECSEYAFVIFYVVGIYVYVNPPELEVEPHVQQAGVRIVNPTLKIGVAMAPRIPVVVVWVLAASLEKYGPNLYE
jgi:hypothetical protein